MNHCLMVRPICAHDSRFSPTKRFTLLFLWLSIFNYLSYYMIELLPALKHKHLSASFRLLNKNHKLHTWSFSFQALLFKEYDVCRRWHFNIPFCTSHTFLSLIYIHKPRTVQRMLMHGLCTRHRPRIQKHEFP